MLSLFTLNQSVARSRTTRGWHGLVPIRAQRLHTGLELGEVSQTVRNLASFSMNMPLQEDFYSNFYSNQPSQGTTRADTPTENMRSP